jgi:hypothetical protein
MLYVVVFGGIFGILALFGLMVMTAQNRRGFTFDSDDPNLVWKELQRDHDTQALERKVANAEQASGKVLSSGKTIGELFPTKPQPFPSTGTSRPKKGAGLIQTTLLGLAAVIGGSVAAGFAFINWTEYQDSANWPTERGQIIEAPSITEDYDSEDSEYSYEPVIRYSYEVDGVVYESDRIGFFGKKYDTRAEAQEVINQYNQPGGFEVLYNPDNPEKAVLERDTDETLLTGLGIGGALGIIVGVSVFLFGLLRGLRAASSM